MDSDSEAGPSLDGGENGGFDVSGDEMRDLLLRKEGELQAIAEQRAAALEQVVADRVSLTGAILLSVLCLCLLGG